MTDEHDPATNGASPSASRGEPSNGANGSRTTGPRGRDLLEALAADLRAMRARVDTSHDLVHQHAGLLSETLPHLHTLTEQVATLTGRLSALTDATNSGTDGDEEPTGPYDDAVLAAHGLLPAPGHQVDWTLMSAAQALPAWEALATWVATVVCGPLGFTRAQLPDCWALHPRAVAELSWAHQLHRLYAGPGVGPTAVADWHTRWLPHLHTRLTRAITLDDPDPLSPSAPSTPTLPDTVARCRLGHYHQLSPRQRRTAEAGLDQRLAEPDRPGHGQRDYSRLTRATVEPARFRDDDGLAAVRRAITGRRREAQQRLDLLLPGHGDRRRDPTRPRYLPVQPVDAVPHAVPADQQPAHPALWVPLYRDAAHHDLERRRHRDHHPDVALDPTVLTHHPDPGRDDYEGR